MQRVPLLTRRHIIKSLPPSMLSWKLLHNHCQLDKENGLQTRPACHSTKREVHIRPSGHQVSMMVIAYLAYQPSVSVGSPWLRLLAMASHRDKSIHSVTSMVWLG